jgi:CyaY protein
MLTEEEYVQRAAVELKQLLHALDELGDDAVEAELANDILTIELGSEPPIVINSHRAARQIWMAADRSAWHFDWNESAGHWVAPKNGDELWGTVGLRLGHRLGRSIVLARAS